MRTDATRNPHARLRCALWAIAIACVPAAAADVWLSTEPPAPAPGQEITVRLLAGERFEGAPSAFDSEGATLFQRVWKRGRQNLKAEEDPQLKTLLDAETPVVTIFGKSWLLHVTEVLRVEPEENLRMVEDSVRFLKERGREVIYDAEHFYDGYTDNPEYALKTLEADEEFSGKFTDPGIETLCAVGDGGKPAQG